MEGEVSDPRIINFETDVEPPTNMTVQEFRQAWYEELRRGVAERLATTPDGQNGDQCIP